MCFIIIWLCRPSYDTIILFGMILSPQGNVPNLFGMILSPHDDGPKLFGMTLSPQGDGSILLGNVLLSSKIYLCILENTNRRTRKSIARITRILAGCYLAYRIRTKGRASNWTNTIQGGARFDRTPRLLSGDIFGVFTDLDLEISNYWCPVNASSSMNINLFEWYNPHSLHDSPKRGFIH